MKIKYFEFTKMPNKNILVTYANNSSSVETVRTIERVFLPDSAPGVIDTEKSYHEAFMNYPCMTVSGNGVLQTFTACSGGLLRKTDLTSGYRVSNKFLKFEIPEEDLIQLRAWLETECCQ